VCSVALAEDEKLIACRQLDAGYTHAENLHVFIAEILKETGHSPSQLRAVAVSRGPGSYTGLRIGVSAAKGLAFALKIPLLSVDTLQVMAAAVEVEKNSKTFICPMIDARRMEVYTAVYDTALQIVLPVNALIVNEENLHEYKEDTVYYFVGNGMPKCREMLSSVKGARFIEDIVPSAVKMAPLAYKNFQENKFEDTAYFEPFYLKEFMAGGKKSS
jgi:tRNA threonylcarbamoyladenosine biosynthesis protein TsaB